ncbi:MAG: SDR family NAD(P)-dependent oxidoreductase [Acidimicrobiia bacterium]
MTAPVVVLTGATKGIGRHLAGKLIEADVRLVAVARSADLLDELKGRAPEGHVVVVAGDVTEPVVALRTVASALETFGRIDVLINNAGGSGGPPPQQEPTLEEKMVRWEGAIRANLISQILFCEVVVPVMKEQGRGRIVNMSSSGGRAWARVGDVAYVASKAGVLGVTRQLARQLAPFGITVNAVAPGTVLASDRVRGRWADLSEEKRRAALASIPMGRLAELDEVIGPILFLALGESDYMTGTVLDVNGGFYMG